MALQELPDEIVIQIFSKFDALTLLTCSCVNKRWNQITNTQKLWKNLVIKKWPSQHWLYAKVPVRHLNWNLIYKEFTQYNWYSPDEMKYFTFSTSIENEPIASSLRQAMFDKVESVTKKWTQFHVHDHDGDMINKHFNQNMELLFNTDLMNWAFLDKRRGYMENLFRKQNVPKSKCYIRPYQYMPSCLVMYRWLCMFRSLATVEPGLTFYRIWRFSLKHIETGLVFELCDWKAAMSSTFSNGQPNIHAFLKDALELLQVLTHPHFIMHPLGLQPRIERSFHYAIRASAGGCMRFHKRIRRHAKRKPMLSPTSPTSNAEFIFGKQPDEEYSFPDIDERLEKWRTRRQLALLPPTMSPSPCDSINSETEPDFSTDTEREATTSDGDFELNGYEDGYVTNCEYYISSSHCFDTIEDQHSLQASIADNWMFTHNICSEKIAVLYDIDDDNWYFQSEKEGHITSENASTKSNENGSVNSRTVERDDDIIGDAVKMLQLQMPTERFVPLSDIPMSPSLYFESSSGVLEPISSALALYRLICLFEVNCSMYNSVDDAIVWSITMMHKKTGGLINLMDYNGMFQVYVSTKEICQQGSTYEGQENEIVMLQTLISEFRASVTQLLDLLMSEDFSHPYGTIAGAVA